MRYLLLSSCLLLGCSSVYKGLRPAIGSVGTVQKFTPVFTTALYKAQVTITGKYLSGLLFIKTMPDSSVRVLFSNEMGFKFFDFGYLKNKEFKVYHIIPQMNKKAVIQTLRNDFALLLMRSPDTSNAVLRKDERFNYYIFPQSRGFHTYITDTASTAMVKMERSSKRKTVVEITGQFNKKTLPDSVTITHKNFHFTINLKSIPG